MLLNGLGLGDELISSVDFVEQVQLTQRVVLDVGEKADGVAHLTQPWVEEEAHANPTLHSLHVSLESVFKIGFDNLDHDLRAVLEDTTMDLADARSSERFHVEMLKVVHEAIRRKTVQQTL